ncbi:hypothetical protein QCA50_000538 [Cerrena zonata]|uniref:Uncharacterized protein n=1 Tax=Cerrena zonata TaxID=2478898 RepID=A0AAW0GWY4_9APHY
MKSSLDELKAQSTQSFTFISHAKESLSDVHELRETVTKSLKDIEPLLIDQGPSFRAAEMRNIVSEFELECINSQQVADLLRDKLKSAADDLVDARNRVTDLEQSQAADRETIVL